MSLALKKFQKHSPKFVYAIGFHLFFSSFPRCLFTVIRACGCSAGTGPFKLCQYKLFLIKSRLLYNSLKRKLFCKISIKAFNRHPFLFHGIPEPDRHTPVCLRIKVVSYTERRANFILAAVSFPYISSVVILTVLLL